MMFEFLSAMGALAFYGTCLAADPVFTKISTEPFSSGGGAQALDWGDFNHDGWIDVFCATRSRAGTSLFTNNTHGSFGLAAGKVGANLVNPVGATWADYDNDGGLDLFIANNNNGNEVDLALAVSTQRWKVEGQVGRGAILLEGKEDWPFDLRLAGEAATVSAKGALGAGERAGTVAADVSADLASAAALAPLGADAARLPMPFTLRARVQYAGQELRADPLHVSIAGQTVEGRMALSAAQPRPRLEAALTSKSIDLTKHAPASTSHTGEPAAKASGSRFADTPLPFAVVPWRPNWWRQMSSGKSSR